MAPKRATRSTRVTPVTPVTPAPNAPTTTTVTEAQLQALINQELLQQLLKQKQHGTYGVVDSLDGSRKWNMFLALAMCPDSYQIKRFETEMWNLKLKGPEVVAYIDDIQQLTKMSFQDVPNKRQKGKGSIEYLPQNNQNPTTRIGAEHSQRLCCRHGDRKPYEEG
ncbi:hypothetical protein Tco_0366046 [Tanacetum coccineum]